MSFKDIRGQTVAIKIISAYLQQGSLQGGYLFTGPEGIGKKLAAKTLAKALNCQADILDACGKCASCLKIANSQHPDIHCIEAGEEEIKIDDIRALQREISFRPYEGKVKVFIIDNAHALTAEASNALLKVLEEPPKQSLIILVSDKPALLFRTIVSRCKTVKFAPLARLELQEILKKDYALEADMAHFLAYFCEGRLGCALQLKDTDIVAVKNSVIDAFIRSRSLQIEKLPVQDKEGLRKSLNILATWFRDMYLMKVGAAHQELIHFDRKDELLKNMTRFTFVDLNEIMRSIADALAYMDQNINSRLLLYNLGAQICKG